jgi:hypothetical protein
MKCDGPIGKQFPVAEGTRILQNDGNHLPNDSIISQELESSISFAVTLRVLRVVSGGYTFLCSDLMYFTQEEPTGTRQNNAKGYKEWEWLAVSPRPSPPLLLFSDATTCPSQTSWSPSRLWPKCNRLLRLGRPWGAVTLSRWGGWWYMDMEYEEGP